jgi:thiol:disulfide interchange protein
MQRRTICAVMLAGVLALTCCGKRDGAVAKFDPARDPEKDVAAAVAQAQREGKRVIVDVGGEWCVWCHILDDFFAARDNADLRELRDARYVWVKVNFSKENTNQAFLSRWPKIEGYPHLFVLDAQGQLVHSQNTGELELGRSYDKEKMIDFLGRYSG